MKYILISFFSLFSFYSIAQTGPGGIGNSTTNGLWLRTDTMTTANGASVASWPDSSGNGNDAAQATSDIQPIFYTSSALNNAPIIRFDGSNDEMAIADSDILDGTSSITMYAVLRPNNLDDRPRGILGKRRNLSTQANYAYTWFFWNQDRLFLDVDRQNNRFSTGSTTFSNATNYILSWNFDGALPTNQRSNIVNGSSVIVTSNETSTAIPNSNQPIALGALNVGYGTYLGADYAEIIQFNYKLNTAEQIIVQNYLSAKYDIALSSNDLYTQDDSANGNFDHDVAGIGQATDGTNHTDAQGSGIVRMHTPSSLSNGDYLFWGEETKDPTYTFSTNTLTYSEELNSKWRVSKVNDLGTVTIAFDISGLDLSGKQSCQPLQLIVDNNANFSSPTEYDLTTTGTTATATGISFTDGDYFTLRYIDEIVWDGSAFFNGSGTANAPNDTDACLKLTVKTGATATLTVNANVREIEVENGSAIHVADGVLLEVENQVEINGVMDLLGEAQLIQKHTSTTSNSGTGELRVRQQGTVNLNNYNYWSAPVNRSGAWQIGYLEDGNGVINFTTNPDADPSTSPITLSNRWLFDFNAVSGEYTGWNALSTTDNLSPGRGYTMKGSGATATDQEYVFKGIPNDGNYTYSVIADNDFLIGNPYPSAIDANVFINDNLSTIDGTLYFWEHFSTNNSHNLEDYEGGYATYNLMMSLPAIADDSGLTSGNGTASLDAPTKNIPVGQGFFVTIANAGSLEFNNGQRIFARESLNETFFYRSNDTGTGRFENTSNTNDDRMKIWLSFKDPGEHLRIIGLGYDANATIGYDRGYDAKAYDDQRNELYWLLNDEKLIISALPQFSNDQELPLGIKITDAGNYTFGIDMMENVPANVTVYLKDFQNGTYYNLSNADATIWLDAMVDDTKFGIVFQQDSTLSTNSALLNDVYIVYSERPKALNLVNLPTREIEKLSIINMLGQQVLEKNKEDVTSSINISGLQNGIYILSIEMDNVIKNFKFSKH